MCAMNAPSSTPSTDHAGPAPAPVGHQPDGFSLPLLIGALGVVFGDIGTSPLYTLQECIYSPTHGVAPLADNVRGIVSLIAWSLTLVVTIKYLFLLMRADNNGEGGIMALLALLPDRMRAPKPGKIGLVALLVVMGAALLFGDGMITPSISVLSAIEGLQVATVSLKPYVVPITVVILIGLFFVQKRGTGGLGSLFGPVMGLWFTAIGTLGVIQIIRHPSILEALSPHYAVMFFVHNGWKGFKVLGGVVMAVTGGEALYADMGHFGRSPIRVAWLALVFPALLLSYLGQGALVVAHPETALQPFYSMVPSYLIYPMVALAAFATVIASQALISGVFSLTHQAMILGYFPRVRILHTSGSAEGQIYVPLMNWGLAAACVALVLVFRESSRLASAYGLAVSGTMLITSFVFYAVTRHVWGWSRWSAGLLLAFFLCFDLPFLVANSLKFFDGGYLPFLVGVFFVVVMVIWRIGRTLLIALLQTKSLPEAQFMAELTSNGTKRIPGTAVFLTSSRDTVPFQMVRMVGQLHVLHERVIVATIAVEHIPTIEIGDRLEVIEIGSGVWRAIFHFGFMQTPNLPLVIERVQARIGCELDPASLLYVLGRESFAATSRGRMGALAERFFDILNRNARNPSDFFCIPHDQVLELGARFDL